MSHRPRTFFFAPDLRQQLSQFFTITVVNGAIDLLRVERINQTFPS
jgi:hypothetical protein